MGDLKITVRDDVLALHAEIERLRATLREIRDHTPPGEHVAIASRALKTEAGR